MQTFLQDLRYGARQLAKNPSFTMVAVFTLALGIGVNTALFTIYDALVLKPLPLSEPESLVTLQGVMPDESGMQVFSYADYQDYRQRNHTLDGLVLLNKVMVGLGDESDGRDNLALANRDDFIGAQIVSANYFSVLRAEMTLGRGFLPEEEKTPLTHPVVVLSYKFWQNHFNGDSEVIGKTIRLRGQSFTIVGVAGREFIGTTPDAPALWVPVMMRDAVIPAGRWNYHRWLTERDADSFNMTGRLKPGVTLEQAKSELSTIARQIADAYPDKERPIGVRLRKSPGFIALSPDDYRKLAPLPLAVGLVLLIACANVANLLLARAALRQREIGVRLAIGASRWRIIRQLLTESLLLSGIGGAAGFLLAWWTLTTLYPVVMARLPIPAYLRESFVLDLEPDYRIFGFAVLASLLAGIVAGLTPAVQASRPDLTAALKEEGTTFGLRLSLSRLRNGLAVAQIAISLILLIAAGLLIRSLQQAKTVDTGMQTANLFSVATSLKSSADSGLLVQLRQRLAERVMAQPNVQSVTQAMRQPSAGLPASTWVTVPEKAGENPRPLRANYNFVSPQYLSTLGIQLLSGRSFSEEEARLGAPVMVISLATMRRFWPELNDPAAALGKRLGIGAVILGEDKNILKTTTLTDADIAAFPTFEVIGISRDTRSGWVWQPDETFLYLPLKPDSPRGEYLLVNTSGDPREVMAEVRALAESLDSRLLVGLQRTEEHLDLQLAPFRAIASLASLLGLLALLLASIGLYGVMAFMVSQRTREIGIRVALGADHLDVLGLFIKQGLKLIGLGVGLGLAGGAAISRLLIAVLVDLSPLDPLTFLSVAALLTVIALLACYFPARRATRVDPMVALRYE